jgi:uncharacterized membrane protein
MKKIVFSFLIIFIPLISWAQCSVCSRNTEQLGDKAASGLNLSILFLAFTPLILIAYIGYRWYKNEKLNKDNS